MGARQAHMPQGCGPSRRVFKTVLCLPAQLYNMIDYCDIVRVSSLSVVKILSDRSAFANTLDRLRKLQFSRLKRLQFKSDRYKDLILGIPEDSRSLQHLKHITLRLFTASYIHGEHNSPQLITTPRSSYSITYEPNVCSIDSSNASFKMATFLCQP